MNFKQNIPLIVGLLIPVLMVLFIAVSIYLPGMYKKANYNFVYASGTYPVYCDSKTVSEDVKPPIDADYTRYNYSVKNGHLVQTVEEKVGRSNCYYDYNAPRFYLHNTLANTNTELTVEDAQKLTLDDSKKSKDGFEVIYSSNGGGDFPFFFNEGRNYDVVYLKNGAVSKKANVQNIYSSGYRQINFIGWVY